MKKYVIVIIAGLLLSVDSPAQGFFNSLNKALNGLTQDSQQRNRYSDRQRSSYKMRQRTENNRMRYDGFNNRNNRTTTAVDEEPPAKMLKEGSTATKEIEPTTAPQSNEKVITLVVNGTGGTKEEATKNALRSAIEQAFGTFVSANTEVVNDELVKDEIATVASGNINRYSILSTTKNDEGQYDVSLQASVCIDNLTNYVKSKGFKVELAGAEFVMNMKMRELNKKNEYASMQYLYKKIESIANNGGLFDYILEKDEPIKIDESHYGVKLKLLIYGNDNTKVFYDEIYKTVQALNLSEIERKEYDKINLDYYIYGKQLINIPKDEYGLKSRSDFIEDNDRRLRGLKNKNRKEWYDDVFALRNYYPNLYQWGYNTEAYYKSDREIQISRLMPILICKALNFDIYDNLGNHFYCSSAKLCKGDQYYVWCYYDDHKDYTFFSINPKERVKQISTETKFFDHKLGRIPAIPLSNYYSQKNQVEPLHFNPLSTNLYLLSWKNDRYEKYVLDRNKSNCYYQLEFIALYSEKELFDLQYIAVKNRNSEILP